MNNQPFEDRPNEGLGAAGAQSQGRSRDTATRQPLQSEPVAPAACSAALLEELETALSTAKRDWDRVPKYHPCMENFAAGIHRGLREALEIVRRHSSNAELNREGGGTNP